MELIENTRTTAISYMSGVDLDEDPGMDRKRILIVEDDNDTVFLLKQIMMRAGFGVMSARSGQEALKKVAELKPDLVLLDLMIPEMDGWSILSYLRKVSNLPIIIISALANKEYVVRALKDGVDDYITKPFYNEEVVARITAVLRRASQEEQVSRLVLPGLGLTIDLTSQEVTCGGASIQLTAKEFAVLSVLAKQAPAIVSYPVIARSVWGQDGAEARKRTKYLVYLLRRKFQTLLPDQEIFINVGRLGYKLQTQ